MPSCRHIRTARTLITSAALVVAAAPLAMAQTSSSSATARLAATVVNPCTKQYVSLAGSTPLIATENFVPEGVRVDLAAGVTNVTGAAFAAVATKYYMSDPGRRTYFVSPGPQSLQLGFTDVQLTANTPNGIWRLTVAVQANIDYRSVITSASVKPVSSTCQAY